MIEDKKILEQEQSKIYKSQILDKSLESVSDLRKVPEKRVSFKEESKKQQDRRPESATRKPMKITNPYPKDPKIDPDLYFQFRDENEKLKKHQNKLNDEVKKLTTQLEKVKQDMVIERKLGDRKIIRRDDDLEIEEVKQENEKLKEKIEKFKTIIQGMQSQQKTKPLNQIKKTTNGVKAQQVLDNQSERNDLLRILNKLRSKVTEQENEILRLNTELYGPNKGGKLTGEYSKELKEKAIQLSDLQLKFEKLQQNYDTNVKVLEHTRANLDEIHLKLNDSKRKNMELEHTIQLQNSTLTSLPDHLRLIDELKHEKNILEERLQNLCEQPFFKDAEERGNVSRKLKEKEIAFDESQKKLAKLEMEHRTNERDLKILREKFEGLVVERDKLKEESLRYKVTVEERDKNSKNFEEQLKMLGQFGEVDSSFNKILNILKLKEDNTSWMNIDFISKMQNSNEKDPEVLYREIERVKIEKGILGAELEKTKSLLNIQQQINEDSRLKYEEDIKILKYQLEFTKNKCEELASLIDMDKVPKDKIHELRKDLFESKPGFFNNYELNDNITEFSQNDKESEMGMNENALDLYIGEVLFEEGLSKEVGFRLSNIMTMAAVDFYLHETQTSNVISGNRPQYNLQLTFKVSIDEHFIRFMESESISIEIFMIKNNEQSILGYAKIPLSQILQVEDPNYLASTLNNKAVVNTMKNPSRVVNNVCQISYFKDNKLMIGNLHYKMRMRTALPEVLKWYREKDQMLKELSPIEDVITKKIEKEFAHHNIGHQGKSVQVTVLISKGTNLKITGPPRQIKPYIFYQFYKFDEHYTITSNGNDPLFDDVERYDVVYDSQFHEYIQNCSIEFFILDDSRALEVKYEKNSKSDIALLDEPEQEDLIGIGKISLKDLLLQDVIRGTVPIFNRKGALSGEIFVNIFWETIKYDLGVEKQIETTYEVKAWTEKAVIMLADKLKSKGLNLESAFAIFDRADNGLVSINDFNDIVLYTLNFLPNQQMFEELKRAIFGNKTTITKLDFHKIFAYLLPHEGPAEQLLRSNFRDTQVIVEHKHQEVDDKIQTGNIVFEQNNQHIEDPNKTTNNFGDNKTPVFMNTNEIRNEVNNDMKLTSPQINNDNFSKTDVIPKVENIQEKPLSQSIVSNLGNNLQNPNLTVNDKPYFGVNTGPLTQPYGNNNLTQSQYYDRSSRKLSDIVFLIDEYLRVKNKRTIVEFFKILDKDGNSYIDKDELLRGFNRLGIQITENEANAIWKDSTINNPKSLKLDIGMFKSFVERNRITNRNLTQTYK